MHAYLAQHCFFLPQPHVPVRIQNATGTREKTKDPSLRKGNTNSGLRFTGVDSYEIIHSIIYKRDLPLMSRCSPLLLRRGDRTSLSVSSPKSPDADRYPSLRVAPSRSMCRVQITQWLANSTRHSVSPFFESFLAVNECQMKQDEFFQLILSLNAKLVNCFMTIWRRAGRGYMKRTHRRER